uniref:C-type lectin domain-containing protein n=1 Tax=Kryptolebias marmoratus TaxID=37003 RepID=A0A3Q3A3M1_KRYMA
MTQKVINRFSVLIVVFIILLSVLVADTSRPPTHSYLHPLPDSVEYRSRSYKVVSGNLSWYDAAHACTESSYHLVSITDAYHQAFLTILVNRLGVPHWIGLYTFNLVPADSLTWVDGSPVDYTNWANRGPDTGLLTADSCVTTRGVDGAWHLSSCTERLGFICKTVPGE